MGMVSGVLDLMVFAKVCFFINVGPGPFFDHVFDTFLNRFSTVAQLFSWAIPDCPNKKYCEILAPWNFLVAATEKNKKHEWLASPYVFLLP